MFFLKKPPIGVQFLNCIFYKVLNAASFIGDTQNPFPARRFQNLHRMIHKLSNTEKVLLLELELHKRFASTTTVESGNLTFPTINLGVPGIYFRMITKSCATMQSLCHSCVKVICTNFILVFPYCEVGY